MFSAIRSFYERFFHRSGTGSLKDKARRLMGIYRALDHATVAFKKASALKCLNPCGECCFSSTVEASELEMIPMAMELVRSGRAEEWYKKAESMNFEGRCVFYSADHGQGKCQIYAFRPLVCRLFAFSGNKDKYGRPRLVTCGLIKKAQPFETEQVLERVAKNELEPPLMADFVMRISSVDPGLSGNSLPINMAFSKAVERVELNQKFRKKG